MIERIVEAQLPVGEKLIIERNRICSERLPERPARLIICTGLHGDELEGQYVCYEVIRRLKEEIACLSGIVDIYPALNPLGIDVLQRACPLGKTDMNRIFPGSEDGNLLEQAAYRIVEDMTGADLCLDIHASDVYVREIPQVRLSEEFAGQLLPYARLMNVDMVWTNAAATVHESTLAHALNSRGVPTLVVEMGLGNRITREYGDRIADGIFNVMNLLGMWKGKHNKVQMPAVSTDGEVLFVRARVNGLFLPVIHHDHYVREGEKLGEIVEVLTGEVKQEILAPGSGLVFTLREYPLVYEGALLARILTDGGRSAGSGKGISGGKDTGGGKGAAAERG